MLYFKSCPKCETGTVEHNSDGWGQYLQCLMCGYQRDFDAGTTAIAALARARQVLAQTAGAEPQESAIA